MENLWPERWIAKMSNSYLHTTHAPQTAPSHLIVSIPARLAACVARLAVSWLCYGVQPERVWRQELAEHTPRVQSTRSWRIWPCHALRRPCPCPSRRRKRAMCQTGKRVGARRDSPCRCRRESHSDRATGAPTGCVRIGLRPARTGTASSSGGFSQPSEAGDTSSKAADMLKEGFQGEVGRDGMGRNSRNPGVTGHLV